MNPLAALLLVALIVLATKARPFAARYELAKHRRAQKAEDARVSRRIDALATAQELLAFGIFDEQQYDEAWQSASRDLALPCDYLRNLVTMRRLERDREQYTTLSAAKAKGRANHERLAALLDSTRDLPLAA